MGVIWIEGDFKESSKNVSGGISIKEVESMLEDQHSYQDETLNLK